MDIEIKEDLNGDLIIQTFLMLIKLGLSIMDSLIFCLQTEESRLSTSSGTERENTKYLGPVSTIMRLLIQKDGDLTSYFDKIHETEAGNTKHIVEAYAY